MQPAFLHIMKRLARCFSLVLDQVFICVLLLFFFLPYEAFAQPFSLFGILNPEGSRLFPGSLVAPRHPGKPDPRWKNFEWQYMDLKEDGADFRLYFYQDESWTAQFAVPELRKEIRELKKTFHYQPSKRFNYLLFSTHKDFQQTHIFNISEGVQGITASTEPTMAIPFWGEAETFRHISTHEMVHQFQTQKIADIGGGSMAATASFFPLWFIEGMAEYYSLHGVDLETRAYIRDLLSYPDADRSYKMPEFFEDSPKGFVQTYKVGQVKIDFLETQFGAGTVQKVLEQGTKILSQNIKPFSEVVSTVLNRTPDEIQKLWKNYLEKNFRPEANQLTQSLNLEKPVPGTGDTIDAYDVSPDGSLIATREIDLLTGRTIIYLIDLKNNKKMEVAADEEPDLTGLFFMELPILALGNHKLAFMVDTTSGPEIEVHHLIRDSENRISIGNKKRIPLHQKKFFEAHSLALSPDEKKLAFVGLDHQSKEKVYEISLENENPIESLKALTEDHSSWKYLNWSKEDEILLSSDKGEMGKNRILLLNPLNQQLQVLLESKEDLWFPNGTQDSFVFQSLQSGSPQIHQVQNGEEIQITDGKTIFTYPRLRKTDDEDVLYVLGLRGGRFHLYSFKKDKRPERIVQKQVPLSRALSHNPWEASMSFNSSLAQLSGVQQYRPFSSSGVRLDNLGAFFGSGSVAGASATVSDLMRDYSVTGEFLILGGIKNANAYFFIENQKFRTKWVSGAYYIVQPREDTLFHSDTTSRFYLHREFGWVGAIQYPLSAFMFTDFELRVGGVNRTDYSDANLRKAFDAVNPGLELMLGPIFRLGYDRVLYETFTGPIRGYGLLLESDTSFFPVRGSITERARIDLSYYLPIVGPTVLAFQGIGGASWWGQFRNPFYVSCDDLFRAYSFGDDRLFGNYLLGLKSEFRFPIGTLFGFPPFRGFIGGDIGSIYSFPKDFSKKMNSSFYAGTSFNFPPLSINLLLSKPLRVAPGPKDSTVLHFTLRYLYL